MPSRSTGEIGGPGQYTATSQWSMGRMGRIQKIGTRLCPEELCVQENFLIGTGYETQKVNYKPRVIVNNSKTSTIKHRST